MAGAHGRKAPLWPGSRCSPHSVSAASVLCVGEHAGVLGGPLSCGGGLALQRSQQAAPASPTQAREEFPRSDRESVHPNLPAPCLGRRGRGPRNPWDNFKSPSTSWESPKPLPVLSKPQLVPSMSTSVRVAPSQRRPLEALSPPCRVAEGLSPATGASLGPLSALRLLTVSLEQKEQEVEAKSTGQRPSTALGKVDSGQRGAKRRQAGRKALTRAQPASTGPLPCAALALSDEPHVTSMWPGADFRPGNSGTGKGTGEECRPGRPPASKRARSSPPGLPGLHVAPCHHPADKPPRAPSWALQPVLEHHRAWDGPPAHLALILAKRRKLKLFLLPVTRVFPRLAAHLRSPPGP